MFDQQKENTIRLITWNCSRGRYDEKRDKLLSLEPDIAIMQEASQSKTAYGQDFWYGFNPKIGIAVLTTNRLKIELGPVDDAALWSIVPLKISGQFSLHLLAVWTRAEEKYIQGLDKALDIYGDFLKAAPSVVVGDFNSNAIWDNPKRHTDFSRVAYRLKTEFGLISAYHNHSHEPFGFESKATHHYRWHKEEPFHIDYCFIPSSWPVEDVKIGKYKDWGAISDHCPLIVDVSLNQENVTVNNAFDSDCLNVAHSGRMDRRSASTARTGNNEFRIYRKVLRMVTELHMRGYQQLRIAPGMSPSGCHWRCAITPVTNISNRHGARMLSWNSLVAHYTSGQKHMYFGWEDAAHFTPSSLADLFIDRFPEIAKAGHGSDWVYAGWYLEMLKLTYPESFPIAYADWDLPKDCLASTGGRDSIQIPLPPPGLGIENAPL